jgi:hypothetical protein
MTSFFLEKSRLVLDTCAYLVFKTSFVENYQSEAKSYLYNTRLHK